jgi:hypothetical protein
VYALDDTRVLRRYRDGWPAAHEAAVMAYVGGLGYPVPKVFRTDGAGLVLQPCATPVCRRRTWSNGRYACGRPTRRSARRRGHAWARPPR